MFLFLPEISLAIFFASGEFLPTLKPDSQKSTRTHTYIPFPDGVMGEIFLKNIISKP
jgi:hypothetical protein